MASQKRELIGLWIAIGIALSLVALNLLTLFENQLQALLFPNTDFPLFNTLMHAVSGWTILLMILAYFRWRAAREREREYLDILSSTGPEVIMVVDRQRQIIRCNDAVAATFGYTAGEVLGKTTDFLYGDRRLSPAAPREIRDALDQTGFHVGEAMARRKNGDRFPIELITTILRRRSGAVIMVRDITERKKTEEFLRKAMQDTEAAHQAKHEALVKLEANYQQLKQLESLRDSLIHMIVHDMKTPLQLLRAHAQILQRYSADRLNAEERDSVDTMLSYTNQLTVMVRSVIDVSRMESGRLPLNMESSTLADLVNDAVKHLGTFARGRQIIVEPDPELGKFKFDREIIHRVLVNLLVNAIKYTPADGEIRVSFSKSGSRVRVYVADTGPGIPADHQKSIFEKFGQVLAAGHRRKGSSGLGLTFCKLAVEAHGGEIGLFSEEGRGSTFWFTLPFYQPAVPLEEVPDAAPRPRSRILVSN
jgi:PAS domain S-box-containing protein